AVGGDDAEAVDQAAVQQVHRVDDQRRVGGVLAGGVGELLDRLDRQALQVLLPAPQVGRGPVAVCTLDRGGAVARNLGEEFGCDRCLRVVGIDQDRELVG